MEATIKRIGRGVGRVVKSALSLDDWKAWWSDAEDDPVCAQDIVVFIIFIYLILLTVRSFG